MRNNRRSLILILGLSLFSLSAQADSISKLSERAVKAADILEDVINMRDNAIPRSLLDQAVCVATVPHMVRLGFLFGARYGKGLVSCRTAEGWSMPSYIKLRGGSWGAQFGIEAVDLVLVFVRESAVDKFSKNNFTVGLDASVAAGPVGRDAQAGTDYKLDSEIYSYSRARGLFAGLTIQGTALTVDKRHNRKVYGDVDAIDLLTANGRNTSNTVRPYVTALERLAP